MVTRFGVPGFWTSVIARSAIGYYAEVQGARFSMTTYPGSKDRKAEVDNGQIQ
ncbi:hypothetical protein MAR_008702 [Mya arenaria]|uniref:Uncharacterized protein n=1 Tax=Mya arenaria TaxID=6604 RepID=A0ABY7DYZ1_MYAAR|nr:hypothetical protein MAR_008702 [Mya arenaria]